MSLTLVPVTQLEAKTFVYGHHRHNRPPVGSVCQVGVANGEGLVGVAMAGHPVARMLQDGFTLEVVRTCTDGTRNANSMLYGAIARAAQALGYRRLITYTLESEPGSSLKAAGWKIDGHTEADQSWVRASRNGGFQSSEHQPDLFGTVKMRPLEGKTRWIKEFGATT